MKCRHCNTLLVHEFIDLGSSPPSNAYLTQQTLRKPERWFPLKVMLCDNCWLVQTEDFVGFDEMFTDQYAYFSSFSASWLNHAKQYVDVVIERFQLTGLSTVVEVAANDGYLLQYIKDRGIPCYGIEPTHSTAEAAKEKGIDIVESFFSVGTAEELKQKKGPADLIIANNVLAHVPDINDFVKSFSILLKPEGIATFEFPHLLNLVGLKQFDTIYHEHYSYLSFIAVNNIFTANGLKIFDVEHLETHGGSLRIYAQRFDTGKQIVTPAVKGIEDREIQAGLKTLDYYKGFQKKAEKVKTDILSFLLQAKATSKKVVAYGAAAKGNTMINYAGISPDLIAYVVDKNPAKQGKFLPGSRIPIVDEERLKGDSPDYVLILPWNIKNEIMAQLDYLRVNGGKFVTAVPELSIL